MAANLITFVEGFTAPRNLTYEKKDDNVALVMIHDYAITIGSLPAAGMLLFQAGIAIAPDSVPDRAAFWEQLLVANNAFEQTSGATLGYDKDNDIVTIQLAWSAEISQEQFDRLCDNFVVLTVRWLEKLNSGAQEETASDNTSKAAVPGVDMLQI